MTHSQTTTRPASRLPLKALVVLCALLSGVSAMQLLDGIAAVVGDDPILVSELDAYVLMRMNELKLRPDSVNVHEFRRRILDEIIDGKVLLAHARRDSMISVDAGETESALGEHIEQLKRANGLTQEQLEQELMKQGMTYVEFKNQMRRSIEEQLLKRNVHQKYMMSIEVTRRDVEAFYKEYRDSLPSLGKSYRMMRLVMPVETPDSVREAAYERMRSVVTRLENGEDFEELARQFSDGPNAENGGDLGFIAKGTLNDLAFEEAAFSLDPGETGDIVETHFGFHVLRVEAKKDQRVRVRQILIAVTPPEGAEESVMTQLDSIRTSCQSIEAFKEAVRTYSVDERSRARDGDIGWRATYELPSKVTEAFDDLKVGVISKIVREEEGLALYYVADHVEDREISIENDYDLLAEKARDILAQKKMAELVKRWRRGLFIDVRIE